MTPLAFFILALSLFPTTSRAAQNPCDALPAGSLSRQECEHLQLQREKLRRAPVTTPQPTRAPSTALPSAASLPAYSFTPMPGLVGPIYLGDPASLDSCIVYVNPDADVATIGPAFAQCRSRSSVPPR